MSRSPQSASSLARSGPIAALVLLASTFPGAPLPAQSSAPASAADPPATHAAPEALPAALPAAPAHLDPAPGARFDTGVFALNHDQPQAPVLSFGVNSGARQQILSTPDSSLPAASFGSLVSPDGFAMGFNAAPAGIHSAPPGARDFGRINLGGFNSFNLAGKTSHPSFGHPGLPIYMYSGPNGSLAAGTQGFVASAPWSLYSANGSLRGSFKLPLGPPAPSLRFIYRAPPAPSSFFSNLDIRKMINTGMYTSPDLGNGVHFSAGTDYNAKSVAGSRKPSGPTVNIKLTF